MNTVSSTDAKSNRSGSQQDTDITLSTSRPPQKSASTSRTSSNSADHYSSSSVSLANDDYFFYEDSSTSSSSFVNPYFHHPVFSSYNDEQYDDNDIQQLQQNQHHKQQQQQQQQRHHHQKQQQPQQYQGQPLQDFVRDASSLADSLHYQGRHGPPLQTQGSSTLRTQLQSHPQVQSQAQSQPPQLPYQDHNASCEDQQHDQQQHQSGGGLRLDDDASRIQQHPFQRTHLLGRDQHEPFDVDDDDDPDDLLDQEFPSTSSQTQESFDPLQQQIASISSNTSSSMFQRPPRPNSSHEVHSNNFITEEEFLILAEDYLLSLSPKKREKALLSNAMYQQILMVLLQPKNTQISTAQFRFWAKKMFTLSTTETHHIVCHSGKPVATKECLYDVLVYCHRKSSHGGRDKTSAEVRQHYSWVPKELIARFVKHCPLCSSRRHSLQRSPSGTGLPGVGSELFAPSSVLNDRNDQRHHYSASLDPFSSRTSQLDQYSMIEPDEAGHEEAMYLNPPHDYRTSQGSLSSYTLPTDRTQLQQGARLHAEHMMQLQHQRMQTESSLGRYYDDRVPYRGHGHLRSSSGLIHDISGVQTVPRGGDGFTHPDSSGVGPPGDRIHGLQSTCYLEGPRRHGGWSRDSRIELDTDHDVEMLDEGSDYDRSESGDVGKRGSHSGVETLLSRGGHASEAAREEERDEDCTPSGLVGIPQEVRAPGSGSIGAIRRSSQNATYNRLYLQQHQQQGAGGLAQYPPGHPHQGTGPGSSSTQPISSSSSGSNQHVGALASRGSSHNRLMMGYPYGYPYPYNPVVGSSGMVYGPIKQSHGSFQTSPQLQKQQQQQQQRQSMLSHSISTTFSQMAPEPLGDAFQELRDYGNEEGRHQGDQSVHMRGESNDGHDQGQGSDLHDSYS